MRTVHPHDRPAVAKASARAFVTGTPRVSSYRQLQADGGFQWVEWAKYNFHLCAAAFAPFGLTAYFVLLSWPAMVHPRGW
jgi:hypothetical protein